MQCALHEIGTLGSARYVVRRHLEHLCHRLDQFAEIGVLGIGDSSGIEDALANTLDEFFG